MREDLTQEVGDRRLAEQAHLRRELLGERTAEPFGATVAAASPPLVVLDADVSRHHPGRLVPEDRVDAAVESPVGPLLAEGPVRSAVEARGRDTAPVVEHLALLGMERDEAALRLAPERAAEAPRACLHRQPFGVRRGDDLGHRPAVVGEVVLRERVQHPGIAARGEVGHVPSYVPDDSDAEVRGAGARRARVEGHL